MDKKQLFLGTLCIIPGLGFLYTLFSPTFILYYSQVTEWYSTREFIIIITAICFIISIGSMILIKLGKYESVDFLEDIRIKHDKKKISNFIYEKMIDIKMENTYDKEHIEKWVDSNYNQIIKDYNNKK